MARIEDHVEADLDRAMGKAPALSQTPWSNTETDAAAVKALRDKAREVHRGTARFSDEERDRALARLILGG